MLFKEENLGEGRVSRLVEQILAETVDRLKTIEEKYGYLSYLIEERFTNEKLLQLEVMRIVSIRPEVVEYLPEKPYDFASKEKCDFWFRTSDSTEHWMEIKMRPTNYRVMQSRAKHAKAITNGVDGIIEDIRRLERNAPKYGVKYVLFVFYPMYPESYPIFNRKHLPRISEAADKEVVSPSRSVQVGDASLDLYFIEL